MSICIEKLTHDCGSSKGLQVFADEETGKVTGYCFACSTFVANPYGEEKTIDQVDLPEPKTDEQIQMELLEVEHYQVLDVAERKLRKKDIEEWGVKVSVKESDGKTPEAMYHPITREGELTGYYVKTLGPEKFTYSVGDVKKGDLYGWERAAKSGAYRLIITEGLEDGPSVEKIYRTHTQQGSEDYIPAVVSLPNGTNSIGAIGRRSEDIKRLFKEVVLCFDDDEAGRRAVPKVKNMLPDAMVVTLPYKDANECVQRGAMKAAYNALRFQVAQPKTTRLINASTLFQEAREPTPWGQMTWPFPKLQDATRGIRWGETIYIGAGVKMGKSELVDQLGSHFITNDGYPIMMAKPEQENKFSVKKMAGKMVGANFTDPKVEFDYRAYDEATKMIQENMWLLDLYQHIGWESLKEDITEAATLGAKAIFIDPITNLTSGISTTDGNVLLNKIAQEISVMAMDMQFTAFIFCHLKSPEGSISADKRETYYTQGRYYDLGGCPHERGGTISSNQFYGSRAMMQKCDLMLGLAGNKDPNLDDEIKRMRWIEILEDRQFGNSGSIPIIWNEHTTQYKEA